MAANQGKFSAHVDYPTGGRIMRPLQTDLSVYNKFEFEKPPVGVKFLFEKPEGIARLDKKLGFCEMLKNNIWLTWTGLGKSLTWGYNRRQSNDLHGVI
jgi:hypothetical protein